MRPIILIALFAVAGTAHSQKTPCYTLEYFNQGGQTLIFEQNLPTVWWAVRMTPLYDVEIDSGYIAFGITKNSTPLQVDSLEVRILNNTLPAITILDQFKAAIPVNGNNQIPDDYWVIEFDFDANTARIAPPHDFWMAWRLKGPTVDKGRILMKKPAVNRDRSVVINANGTTTPVYQYLATYSITDTADLWAESHVWYYNGVPVELVSFAADYRDGAGVLEWTTASETNNAGFEIERLAGRSDNGGIAVWQIIGFVRGHGTSALPLSYSFIDADPRAAADGRYIVRYRLRQIDYDGAATRSAVAELRLPPVVSGIDMSSNHPNPVTAGSPASFTFSVASPRPVRVALIDALGRESAILAEGYHNAGTHTVILPTADLPSGTYACVLTSGEVRISRRLTVIR